LETNFENFLKGVHQLKNSARYAIFCEIGVVTEILPATLAALESP